MSLLDHLPFHKKHEEIPDFSQDPFADEQADELGGMPGASPLAGEPTMEQPDPFAGMPDAQGRSGQEGFPGQPQSPQAFAKQLVQEARNELPPDRGRQSDLQLILERLDTIKAELDSIKQRMYRFDRFLDKQEQHRVW